MFRVLSLEEMKVSVCGQKKFVHRSSCGSKNFVNERPVPYAETARSTLETK
jgi:hypothetical protein